MDERPKITLKHSRIEIADYNPGDSSYLEYLFSHFDPIRHQRYPKCIEYDNVLKTLILPRGIAISTLKRAFKAEPFVDMNCDAYIDTPPLVIKYMVKDDRQEAILRFLVGMPPYEYTLSKSQLAVNSTTGSGKTFVTVAAMCIQGSRIVIITSSINWLNQWKEKILEYTLLDPSQIYMITGRSSIEKLFVRDTFLNYQVFLASHSTLQSFAVNNPKGWYAVDELFQKLQCSTKIFDEAHLYLDNMAHIDYHSNVKKTIYLTATPARSDKEENAIYQTYFQNIPSISLFDENTDPHVNYIGMLFYSHPSPHQVQAFSTGQFKFDRHVYTDYLVNNPNFLNLVLVIVDMCLRINGKVLMYIGKNSAIAQIRDHIIANFPFLANCIGIYNSEITDKAIRRQMLMKKFILSTTKSCGAASDIDDLAVTVVLAEPFHSAVIAQQTLGRCRKPDTLYIDCIDLSVYRTRQYYKDKQPIFMRFAKSCQEMMMSDELIARESERIRLFYGARQMMTLPVFSK